MTDQAAPEDFDPRPRPRRGGDGTWKVDGLRCIACGHDVIAPMERCALCGGSMGHQEFGPTGVVWASTVLRVRVPGRVPPMALAYVVLDDGPRILAHLDADRPADVGATVELVGETEHGDVLVAAGGAR